MFDVCVIGGGVIGGMILRELSRYRLNVCMLEKEQDVAMGQSGANSGIVHAGFDAPVGSNKAKFNVIGSEMMKEVASELGVDYVNNGSLVVAFNQSELGVLAQLKERGIKNGVKGLTLLDKDALRKMEKNVSDDAVGALYAPTGAIICPHRLTIASIGNAMDNGAQLFTGFEVVSVKKQDGGYTVISADNETIESKVVINCAGIGSEKIANAFGDFSFTIGGRKGEYILLDKECGDFVKSTLFFTPTELGKGILVSPTVDGNILLGPTATIVSDGNTQTSEQGLEFVKQKASTMCKNVPFFNTITSFAGTRAFCQKNDFIIEKSTVAHGLINCVGIESPGLSSSPAIAKFVVEELVSDFLPLEQKQDFNGKRVADNFFEKLNVEQKNQIIKDNYLYGKIVCRCELISEGEIVRAVNTNPKATTVDAVKRRTRAGMGRCQGGFCQPQVVEIIARELNIELEQVTKKGKNSYLLSGRTK